MPPETSSILAQVFWHAPHLWPVAALAALALLAAVLLLYPAQLGMVPWPWRGILPGLRLLAALTLVASLLKPVAMRPASADERGAVVVLVDRSQSMAVVDNARTPAQLVPLADALGKLRPNVRSDAATALAAGLERLRTSAADVRSAQEDLDYARVSGRDIQFRQKRLDEAAAHFSENVAALLDKARALPEADELVHRLSDLSHPPDLASRDGWRVTIPQQIKRAAAAVVKTQETSDARLYSSNADVRSACDAIAALSRFSLVEQALLRPDGIVAAAHKDAAVTGFGIGEDATPLELVHDGKVVTALNAVPDADKSDITRCIARAVVGKPVRAVVLFSDGRQVGGDPTIVSGLTPNGVPIFTVSAAASVPPHDLSFASIRAPASIFAGQAITVKAELRHDYFDGQTVELHCEIGNEKDQVRKIQLHAGKPAAAEFTARLSRPDPQHPNVERIRLWFPKVAGEASGENNQSERWVKVVPQPLKVLLIAGAPTWDFQFVRNSLNRLPEMQVKELIVDPANPRPWIAPAEILSQDVILLFDVPISMFDQKHWEAVLRMAQVTGGSVILVAGDSHLPAEYFRFSESAALLPFQTTFKPAWIPWPGQEPGIHFVPAPDAESLEFLNLPRETEVAAGETDPAQRRWEQLPGCFRFLQLPEIHNKELKPQVRALLVEEDSRLPVLTEMRLGAGRAFFLGFNETWRWRFKVGGRDQEHFWRQLILHASEDPYFAHNGPLALDADKVSAHPNERIHIRAHISEEVPEPPPAYTIEVLRDKSRVLEVPLTPSGPAGGGRFIASLTLPAGDYVVRWTVNNSGRSTHSVSMPLKIGATNEDELADLSGDPAMLRKLAEASGGEFLTLDQIGRLPERLAAAGDAQSRLVEFSLWDSPYLFAMVVGCLGAEWALRKRVGLA